MKPIFLILLFFSFNLKAEDHLDLAWLKLVHYKKTIFGYKSEADGAGFFFSKEGKDNPKLELMATIEAMKKTAPLNDEHPACRFPARYEYLKEKFKLKEVDQKNCSGLQAFREKISAKRAFVVFSSYFINTPASAFGHTLLRFEKDHKVNTGEHSELLDYGINYAANVTTDNALIYAYKGLTGGFEGLFTSIPYYYKIREYNDYESRDLFSYELKLTPKEIHTMVLHLWELGQTHFDYFYLTENCSYHILSLIEVARPELDLFKHIPFYIIPIDTVKALFEEKDLIRNIDYRPSLRSKLFRLSEKISDEDKQAVKKMALEGDFTYLNTKESEEKKAELLDLAIDLYDYKYAGKVLLGKDMPEAKRELLLKRAENQVETKEQKFDFNPSQYPHLSHGSERISLSFGQMEKLTFSDIEMRFALHDLLDPQMGQSPNLFLEFMKINMRYFYQEKKYRLDELSIFQVMNLAPFNSYEKPFSWRANFGAKTIYDQSCDQCLASNIELAGGMALNLDKKEKLTSFFMLDGEIQNSSEFNKNPFRLGLGPLLGLYYKAHDQLNFLGKVHYKEYYFIPSMNNMAWDLEGRYSFNQSSAISLRGLWQTTFDEYRLGLHWYF